MSRLVKFSFLILCLCGLIFGQPPDSFKKKVGNRIVDGTTAVEGQFPYQVSVRFRNSHNCGGSILNKRWILTAAHCIAKETIPRQTAVVVGTNDLLHGGQRLQPEKLILHPEFNNLVLRNDVGLVKVDKDIEFNEFVQPIRLPTYDISKINVSAVVSGWGLLSGRNRTVPQYLQYFTTFIEDQEECKGIGQRFYTDRHICTYSRFGQGTCYGDSGDPLVVNGTQIGIGCYVMVNCGVGLPDVFTRVWSFVDWIYETINNN